MTMREQAPPSRVDTTTGPSGSVAVAPRAATRATGTPATMRGSDTRCPRNSVENLGPATAAATTASKTMSVCATCCASGNGHDCQKSVAAIARECIARECMRTSGATTCGVAR
jgi:hypothetical protein